MNVCKCDSGLGNLGTPVCVPKFGISRRLIFVPIVNSDGDFNTIDPSIEITDAFIEAKLNEADPTKRWYLTPEYKNGTSERGESEFEEFDDGSKEKIRTAAREISLMFVKQDTTFLSKLEKNECVDLAVFDLSDNGSIRGICPSNDGLLYPVPIQAYDTNWNPQLDTAVEKVMLGFEWKRKVKDGEVRFISSSEFSGTFDNKRGLLDVMATNDASAALSFTATMRLCYGSKGNEILHTGLELADITELYNVTADAALSVDSITETSNGVYDIVYTGATAANDVLRLTITKQGFDYSQVKEVNFGY